MRQRIADTANQLPFVEWDRTVLMEDYGQAVLYGWIRRDDGRADFVVLQFWDDPDAVAWVTSSAEYSPTINDILTPELEHNPCRIAANELPGIDRHVPR